MPPAAHPPRRLRRALMALTLLPLGGWGAASAALWLGQERLLFRPERLPPEARLSDEPDVHELAVEVPGARLSVLQLRLPAPRGVVFFLHGNGGHLRDWFTDGTPYRRAGLDLVMMDYRGYGKSSGRIGSEAELHDDVEAVWQAVAPRYAGLPVLAYGRSLGSGLAAAWAARHQPALTILVSPYTSMRALADLHYPWVPDAVLRYPLRTDQAVARLRRPLLLVHGGLDRLIPPSHSQALAALAPREARAELLIVPGAGHGDLHAHAAYRQRMDQAMQALG